MLHTESVQSSTLELIKALQQKEYLKGFYLVGGTALALYYGHRQSIDIDLFSNKSFDEEQLLEQIHQDYSYQLFYTATNTLKGSIADTSVDIIAHRYPYLNEPKSFNGISILSDKDIIAMKLNAISVSGQRSKDFIDIYYGLNKYTIADMVSFYKIKYKQSDAAHILKSLVCFDDVDFIDWPVLIIDPDLKWSSIKWRLEKEMTAYIEEG